MWEALNDAERDALLMLANTAFLACRGLDNAACAALAKRGLADCDSSGYWRITTVGQTVIPAHITLSSVRRDRS